ncbi:uncharacterized protein [Physcomitrium patens]|uniref:Uncharacterized protein n=1 Tax=Physcomitrium patens TaxID=3218 RepID=A0A2K1J581_PHYPA|nr:serine/arginine repetitive matrix protein 1-like [Physcomitrium patens]XP_024400864.1 serine/arginine repetitive matrix protein 1-like [Physcomitrium patens]XP_024400865.1 serine/arginine repetitive matrix protein 1-like [Physcomitrium patens]XP_024400866.1 serine/arginine repetitive matrix protein 1-like [Physcomitrium patens]XP_024400867.1 serine/arginine repetitive matrix protein 1-like [Physcomitrium patens]XP_024400869.1 serine/arginine repetitive matrix protein 1-like [Physcomitrium p|eukprot:XP_024400863.1 serine/arginine repetitive matrix protein 1-like [Physcomitrella patens]
MAFAVSRKVSHDFSSALGKGLHGLKVEAMANQGKPKTDPKTGKKESVRRRLTRKAIPETIMLGIFTVMVAAVPVILISVPAPESVLRVKEIMEDWCTPSICFVVLIVGIVLATSGALGGSGGRVTPEQNHKLTESYLIQRPVSASQMDPLRMPDIFFSADTARQAHTLSHAATFPVRAAQPTSVFVPVYYPAFLPSQSGPPFSHRSPKDVEVERFMPRRDGRFESNLGERFVPRVEERFLPTLDERLSPMVVDLRFSPRVEDRFKPRMVDERFSPNVDDRFSPRVDDRFSPEVEERFQPQLEERFEPQMQERFDPQMQERFDLQIQERFDLQMQERFDPQSQERFEVEEEDVYEAQEEVTFDVREEKRYAHDDDEARSDFDDDLVEEAQESSREDGELESEREEQYVETDADDEGGPEHEVGIKSDSEDEVEHYTHNHNYFEADVRPKTPQSIQPPTVSTEHSPAVPPTVEVEPVPPPLPPSQRQSYGSSATLSSSAEDPPSLLSRRKPPTVPAPLIVQKASEPEPVNSHAGSSSVQESSPKVSINGERKRDEPETNRSSGLSPPTPPEHPRRPFASSSSRSYAEFVKRTTKFSPKTPIEPPPKPPFVSPVSTPKGPSPPKIPRPEILASVGTLPKVTRSPKSESIETEAMNQSDGKNSSSAVSLKASSPSLVKQEPIPVRKPREVRVVDDDSIETDAEKQDDDVDQRVEAFLRKFREQIRLQRQESLQRHRRGESLDS